MNNEKIIVVGDLHGQFGQLNRLISELKPAVVLQCGDFGFWPRSFNKTYVDEFGRRRKWDVSFKNKDTHVYWCDGNHEDHWSLKDLTDNEVFPNIFYMKRGSVIMLPDGRNVLFMGGAYSIDKKHRTLGVDWFPEETITQADIEALPDVKIDMVISHTAPYEFNIDDYHEAYGHDPSRDALTYVLEKYRPKRWFCGHMHRYMHGFHEGCIWTCLSYAGHSDRWWVQL